MEGKDWRTALDYLIFQYRSTPHTTTNESPSKLLMGRELRGKFPSLAQPESVALQNAKLKHNAKKQKSKNYFDKKHKARSSHIRKGDKVLLKQKR